MTYHLRNDIPLVEYEAGVERARTQEEYILSFFRSHSGERFTPFQVWQRLFTERVPITSIRRAITDLTTEGKLIKHEEDQRREMYGAVNCTWSFAGRMVQGELGL